MKIRSAFSVPAGCVLVIAALSGCANNPILGLESGDKGVFFKRLSIGCVVGKSTSIEMAGTSLSQEEAHPGDILTHTVVIERCVKEEDTSVSAVKVTRQIMLGADALTTSTVDVSSQITRNGVWDVKSQINIGKNPPGRYAVRTTVDVGGRKQVRVDPFVVVQ